MQCYSHFKRWEERLNKIDRHVIFYLHTPSVTHISLLAIPSACFMGIYVDAFPFSAFTFS